MPYVADEARPHRALTSGISILNTERSKEDAWTVLSYLCGEEGNKLFNQESGRIPNSFDLVGKTSVFDIDGTYVFASYLIRVVTDLDQLLPACLNHYMNLGDTQRRLKMLATRGVSQSNISATKLKGLSIGVPPIAEQQSMCRTLSAADGKIESEEDRKTALQALFASMLEQLMTGRVRVKE